MYPGAGCNQYKQLEFFLTSLAISHLSLAIHRMKEKQVREIKKKVRQHGKGEENVGKVKMCRRRWER